MGKDGDDQAPGELEVLRRVVPTLGDPEDAVGKVNLRRTIAGPCDQVRWRGARPGLRHMTAAEVMRAHRSTTLLHQRNACRSSWAHTHTHEDTEQT